MFPFLSDLPSSLIDAEANFIDWVAAFARRIRCLVFRRLSSRFFFRLCLLQLSSCPLETAPTYLFRQTLTRYRYVES